MKISNLFFSIIIFVTFILVGNPIDYNCFELNLAVIIVGMIFGVKKIFIKKEKLIDSQIDLLVLMFYLSPIISIMFDNCSSLEETLIAVVKNISLFNIFCMAKDIIKKDKKQGEFIIDILIAGGILLVLLGIDERLSKTIFQYVQYIGIPSIGNHEERMFSTIGYANSFAIIMAIEIFLCFYKLKSSKIIYSGLIYLFLFGMLLSYSRSVLVLFAALFIIYLIFLKRKRVYAMYNCFQNVIVTLTNMKVFETLYVNNRYILAWASIIFFFIISILIAKYISKNYKRFCKIKFKTYVKILIFLVVLIIAIYFIGKLLDIPLHIFNNGEINKQVKYKVYNVEEIEYCFKFYIKANISETIGYDLYTIQIDEENKYYDTIHSHTILIGEFEGIKEIKFTPSDETVELAIYIKSNDSRYQNGLTINSLYINDKKFALNYLYLPTNLVERIESFSINNKSLWERFVFSKDALKIIKENIFFGLGAKGWQYNYEEIQSYKYSSKEVHNFAFQIFIENGIIGFLLLIDIIVYFIIRIIKRKNINEIDIAFILLTMHSIIDFNLSFYLIMVIWILLFTLSTQNNRKVNNISKRIELNCQNIIIILNILILCVGIYTYKVKSDNEYNLELIDYAVKTNNDNEAIRLIKEFNELKKNKKYIFERLILIDYEKVEEDNLNYVYNIVKNEKIVANTKYNIDRNRIIKKIITTSINEEMIEKCCEIIIEENDLMISNIKDVERNRLTQEVIISYLEIQKQIYELACNK